MGGWCEHAYLSVLWPAAIRFFPCLTAPKTRVVFSELVESLLFWLSFRNAYPSSGSLPRASHCTYKTPRLITWTFGLWTRVTAMRIRYLFIAFPCSVTRVPPETTRERFHFVKRRELRLWYSIRLVHCMHDPDFSSKKRCDQSCVLSLF